MLSSNRIVLVNDLWLDRKAIVVAAAIVVVAAATAAATSSYLPSE